MTSGDRETKGRRRGKQRSVGVVGIYREVLNILHHFVIRDVDHIQKSNI